MDIRRMTSERKRTMIRWALFMAGYFIGALITSILLEPMKQWSDGYKKGRSERLSKDEVTEIPVVDPDEVIENCHVRCEKCLNAECEDFGRRTCKLLGIFVDHDDYCCWAIERTNHDDESAEIASIDNPDREQYQSCENCYYMLFDEKAYPCSRCDRNGDLKNMWRAKIGVNR